MGWRGHGRRWAGWRERTRGQERRIRGGFLDAMILAAGLGTRLGELGARRPKALIEVGGLAMIERVARALIEAGADRLIVNLHHHAADVRRFVEERDGFGVEVLFSEEVERPLETGGGLLQAAGLFRRNAPFLLHNVDVITNIDLATLHARHVDRPNLLATLVVQHRKSSRALMFDDFGLFGRSDERSDTEERARAPTGSVRSFAFAGIHVISPRLLDAITERGAFSILQPYLRLAAVGERIAYYDATTALWLEIGSPERLAAARDRLG